ncbi:MAG: hypothetical protein H0W50_11765 [Parachlamydiaceae bacterium]|nr:hypothetical protein [Parachlamydiaceae bacterium]
MEKSHYICTERLNWTAQFTKTMEEINHSSHTILGPVSSRIAGFVVIPIASLIEAFAHAFLAGGKTLTGFVVSPYNCIANACFPKYSLSQNLEFSSALIHLILAIESIFTAALLPFACLLNPARADAWINSRSTIQELQYKIQELKEEQLKTANKDLDALREENDRLVNQLNNLPTAGNSDLLNRIEDLETRLQNANKEMEDLSKSNKMGHSQSQTEQKDDNLSNSVIESSGPGGAMKIGTKPRMSFAETKAAVALKAKLKKDEQELENSQKTQVQPKNSGPPRKKINLSTSSSGPVTEEQLKNFQFKSTSNLSQSQSLTNSSQSPEVNANNISSSTSDSDLLKSGFEKKFDKLKDLSNSQQNQLLQDYKNRCEDIYNEIKGLEKGKFLKEHQTYLDKMSNPNMYQVIEISEEVKRITRWIDSLEDKDLWDAKEFDFSASMSEFGLTQELNKLNSDQLLEIIDKFKEYKLELEKLQKGQISEEQFLTIQKQKIELEAVNKKSQLEQLEERKHNLLLRMEFESGLEFNENCFLWKTFSFEQKTFLKPQEFLDRREKMINVVNLLNSEDQMNDDEFNKIIGVVNLLNDAFGKAAKK